MFVVLLCVCKVVNLSLKWSSTLEEKKESFYTYHLWLKLRCSDYPDFEASLPSGSIGYKLDSHKFLLWYQGWEIIWNTAPTQPGLGVGFYLTDEKVVLRLASARPLHIELVNHQFQFSGICLQFYAVWNKLILLYVSGQFVTQIKIRVSDDFPNIYINILPWNSICSLDC